MSAALLLDELLSGFAAPAGSAWPDSTPAKAANPANREHWRGLPADSAPCEGLRILANPAGPQAQPSPNSQTFAAVRNPSNGPGSEEQRGFSQDSQDSQGLPGPIHSGADLAAVAWTDGDIAGFLDRRARLLRWGWAEPEAERLAERLVRRDREQDDRVSCGECGHYRPGRCGNHRAAWLYSPELSRDLAALLQRCPGFKV